MAIRYLYLLICLLLTSPLMAQDPDIIFLQTASSKIIFPEGHTRSIRNASFSPDARKFVTVSEDGTAKVWETNSGKLLLDIKKRGEGENLPVENAEFSPDGEKIVAKYYFENRVVSLKTGSNLNNDNLLAPKQMIQFSRDAKFYVSQGEIYDSRTMRLLRKLKGIQNYQTLEGYSPDGNTIVVVSYDEKKMTYSLRTFQAKTGLPLTASIPIDLPEKFDFTPDGQKLILYYDESDVEILDAKTLKSLYFYQHKPTKKPGVAEKVMSSPGAEFLLIFSGIKHIDSSGRYPEETVRYDSLTVKDIRNEKTVYSRGGILFSKMEQYDLFGPDGKSLMLPFADSTLQIIQLASGQPKMTLKSWAGTIDLARFSPDGKFFLTVTPDHIIRTYRTNSTVLISALKDHTATVNTACFNNDNTKVLSAGADMTARVWENNAGIPVSVAGRKTQKLKRARFTPDGKNIHIETEEQILIWNIQGSRLEKEIADTLKAIYYQPPINPEGRETPNGKYNVFWTDRSIMINELPKGREMIVWNKDMEAFNSIEISPDSRTLLVTTEYNVMQLLEMATAKVLFTFVLIDSSNFLVTNGKNHYDGTRTAREMIHFICDGEVLELSQVKEQLWVPGLAERIMSGDSINAITFEQLAVCNKAPVLEDLSTDSLYRFRIIPKAGGLGKTVVGLNGYEYRSFEPKNLKRAGNYYEISIAKSELIPYLDETENNQLIIRASTSTNDLPSRTLTKTVYFNTANRKPPNLFAVMVGTSNYKDDKMDLQFAAVDASKLAVTLEEAAGKLLGKEHVFVYTLTTDIKTSYPEKGAIKNIFTEISKRASPNDILMIFLSGHGVMEEKTKEFFYLTAEATSLVEENLFKNAGISMSELTEWIKPQSIKARKRVLILDACQSGQAINNMLAFNRNMLNVKGDEEARQIKAIEKLNEKSGLYILSASASTQSAYESEEYGHGYLTYSLLKGIKENPAILEDGKYLNITRWFNEASEMVSELAKKDRSRQEPQVVSTSQFNIGLVDQELIQKIQLLSPKPLFVQGNFLNRDEAIADDNLGIRKLIDTELQKLSTGEGGKKIVFTPQSASPDAYSLSGSYLVKDQEIDIKIRLKKGNTLQFSFDLKGRSDQVPALVSEITRKAIAWIREQTNPGNPDNNE